MLVANFNSHMVQVVCAIKLDKYLMPADSPNAILENDIQVILKCKGKNYWNLKSEIFPPEKFIVDSVCVRLQYYLQKIQKIFTALRRL